uniref:Putative secreted peptide n=1 Tax=Anopheles braziliensis TaxID=58242 RepID=A0A2M3ZSM3_9DIPT
MVKASQRMLPLAITTITLVLTVAVVAITIMDNHRRRIHRKSLSKVTEEAKVVLMHHQRRISLRSSSPTMHHNSSNRQDQHCPMTLVETV